MNRIIKFRGKRVDNGEWVYGDLVHFSDHIEIYEEKKFFENGIEVIPETVGQFTGLPDKDGKDIYEGDIVKNNNGIYLKIYWNDDIKGFMQINCNMEQTIKMGYEWIETEITNCDLRFNNKEIIGNLTESPELLNKSWD